MRKYFVFIWLTIGFGSILSAQIGGQRTFQFLDLGTSARIASLGGEYLSVKDADITVAITNPSLIDKSIHNHLAFNFVNYFGGLNYGFASYSRTFDKAGSFAAQLQYGNYGKADMTDEYGNITGAVHASDLAFTLGWGYAIDTHFSVGANLKFIYSNLDIYHAMAIGLDISATFVNKSRNYAMSLLVRNIGAPVKHFYSGGTERLPFEIGLAFSQKIPKAPIRLFWMLTDLQKWDLAYSYQEKAGARFFDNFARHLTVGLEIIPYKGFYLRAAYTYGRRDMMISSRSGMVGFSWGLGVRFYKINLSYARSAYHLVGSPNYITLTLDLDAYK